MVLPNLTTDFKETNNMCFNAHLPLILRTALDLGLFDTLAEGARDLEQLAGELGTHGGMTGALVDILCEWGYLEETGGNYSLSPVSREFLVSTSPAFQGKVMEAMANMSQLLGSAKTIMTNEGAAHNEKMWASTEMMEMMLQSGRGGNIQAAVAFVASLPEFPAMRRMCDIAGSFGYYSMGILGRNPDLSAVVCDLPEVAELAGQFIIKEGFEGRLKPKGMDLEAGDDFGQGYDLVFVSNYLYAWSRDERLVAFLKRVRAALAPGGVFVSRHMTSEVTGESRKSQLIMEYVTRLGGYPTHAISEARLTAALVEAGFTDFTVARPGAGSYDNTLTIAARVSAL